MELIKNLDSYNKFGKPEGLFLCPKCGKEVIKTRSNGKKNKTCGCFFNKYHNPDIYNIWKGMKTRCYDYKYKKYNSYKKKNIKVCKEWLHSYDCFHEWVISHNYKKGLQLDRINNNGDYESSNCRFVTNKINCRNRNNKLNLEKAKEIRELFKSKMFSKASLGRIYNVSSTTITDVVKNKIWV